MVTTLVPDSSRIVALQAVVPDAVPDPPVDATHLTATTPTLSAAVPLNTMLDEVVETIVEPGASMVIVGATVSRPEGGVVGGFGVGVGGGAGSGVVGFPAPP